MRYRDTLEKRKTDLLALRLATIVENKLDRYTIENIVSVINDNYSGNIQSISVYRDNAESFAKAVTVKDANTQVYFLYGTDATAGRVTKHSSYIDGKQHNETTIVHPDFDMDEINIAIVIPVSGNAKLLVYMPVKHSILDELTDIQFV